MDTRSKATHFVIDLRKKLKIGMTDEFRDSLIDAVKDLLDDTYRAGVDGRDRAVVWMEEES